MRFPGMKNGAYSEDARDRARVQYTRNVTAIIVVMNLGL